MKIYCPRKSSPRENILASPKKDLISFLLTNSQKGIWRARKMSSNTRGFQGILTVNYFGILSKSNIEILPVKNYPKFSTLYNINISGNSHWKNKPIIIEFECLDTLFSDDIFLKKLGEFISEVELMSCLPLQLEEEVPQLHYPGVWVKFRHMAHIGFY
jgi:hypothetical protein